jgi:hypothetical protein
MRGTLISCAMLFVTVQRLQQLHRLWARGWNEDRNKGNNTIGKAIFSYEDQEPTNFMKENIQKFES